VFGPAVEIVRVTVVAPEPAAICVEVACPVLKTQLLFVNVGSVGAKAQLNVTAPAKVDPPPGVAVKLYAAVVCPARTVSEVLVAVKVKVGGLTVSISAADVLPELFKSPA
jgi:hypothetical protein